MAFLVILKEGRPFLRFRLDKERTTIGRDNDVDLYVPDAHISRLHCIVRQELDGFRAIDRSTNGTFVNGIRARAVRLQDQDIIRIGGCDIRFELSDLEEAPSTVQRAPEGGAISYDAHCERVLYARPVVYVRESGGAPIRIPISRDTVQIGSGERVDIKVKEVEEKHYQLLATTEGFILRNQCPGRPVLLDGEPVVSDTSVPYGSEMRVGRTSLRLVMEEGEDRVVPLNVTQFEGMIGTSPEMHKLFGLIARFACHDAPLIIFGETGTGKELVARALHRRSHRSGGPFVALNCSAISPNLFESELFGHVKGAFTGASQNRVGAFEAAHRGVLFLDELGELPLELQPKLLRVLETSSVSPVGSYQPRSVDVRVIAATHKNLSQLVDVGEFRADLFYRLFVLTVELPPLRERRSDLRALVRHFLDEASPPGEHLRISTAGMSRLIRYDWPGNIRELKHALTRAIASASVPEITVEALRFLDTRTNRETAGGAKGGSTLIKLEDQERQSIMKALTHCGRNRSEAARMLGIARSTLHVKMKKYGLIEF